MKKTICDKCGAEFVGRNPPGFKEVLINGNTYADLCEDCYNEYYLMKCKIYKNIDQKFNKNVINFLS